MCRVLLEHVERFLRRSAQNVMNFVDLVQLIVAREEWEQRQNFKENTTHTPNVHLVTVVAVRHQALRRSVPASRDVLSQRGFIVKTTTTSQVRKLYDAITQKNVFWFDVAMKDPIPVHVLNCLHKLINVSSAKVFS